MRLKTVFFSLLTMLTFFAEGYSLDWKALHEEAEGRSLSQAEQKAKENPDSLDNLYLLGLVCLKEYRDEQALSVFSQMQQRAPHSAEAQWGEAEVLRRQYNLDKSQEILKGIKESLITT